MEHQFYLEIAEQLLCRSDASAHLDSAIAALELSISASPPQIAEYECRARLLFAQTIYKYTTETRRAEDIVLKALVKVHNQDSLLPYRFAFNELLSRIYCNDGSINAAKRLMKESIMLCVESGRRVDDWHFIFLLRGIEMNLTPSSLRALRQFCSDRSNDQALTIANILDSVLHISQNLPIPPAFSFSVTTDVELVDTSSFTMLDYMHLSLSILGDLMQGNVVKPSELNDSSQYAQGKLSILHKGLDLRHNLDAEVTVPITTIGINGLSVIKQITISTFSTRRFMIFVYVLSALVHLAEMTSSRCEKFLAVGQDLLKQGPNEAVSKDEAAWTVIMQDLIHTLRAFNYLLRSKIDLVAAEVSQISREDDLKVFLCGCFEQQMGNLDAALYHYSLVVQDDLKAPAILNTILIYSGSIKRDDGRLRRLLSEVEPLCTQGSSAAAYQLVKSISPVTTSVALKRALNSVLNTAKLQANTQLNMLALSILGLESTDPDEMRIKFALHALSQANKSAVSSAGVCIWSHVNGSLAEEIMDRKLQTKSKTEEVGKAFEKLEKIKAMNQQTKQKLKLTMPMVYERFVTG